MCIISPTLVEYLVVRIAGEQKLLMPVLFEETAALGEFSVWVNIEGTVPLTQELTVFVSSSALVKATRYSKKADTMVMIAMFTFRGVGVGVQVGCNSDVMVCGLLSTVCSWHRLPVIGHKAVSDVQGPAVLQWSHHVLSENPDWTLTFVCNTVTFESIMPESRSKAVRKI